MANTFIGNVGRFWSYVTGHGASLVALGGFIIVSVIATAMGFTDLRLANAGKQTLSIGEALPIWGITLFVILTMVAALNAALGLGMKPVQEKPILTGDPALDANATTTFKPWRLILRGLALFFYFFFAFWSIGFGYGFFWKELAGEEYTRTQFSAAIENVSTSVNAASEALDTVETSVISAATTASERADEEAANGGTCANRPNSIPGDGPLTRARFAFADRASALRDDVSDRWINRLTSDKNVLERRIRTLSTGITPTGIQNEAEADLLAKLAIASRLSSSEREQLFTQVFDDARAFTAKANSLRASNAGLFASRLSELARGVGPDPDNPNRPDPARVNDPSYCWDTVLTEKILASAQSLRSLEDMPTPEFEFTEGPKATRAAFFNLASTVSYVLGAPLRLFNNSPEPDKLVKLHFGEKEYIALFASIAVDLGILFLTLVRAMMENRTARRIARRPEVMRLKDVHEAYRHNEFSGR